MRRANKTCYINARLVGCAQNFERLSLSLSLSLSVKQGTKRMPGSLARCRSFTDSRCMLAYKFIVYEFVHNKQRRQTVNH